MSNEVATRAPQTIAGHQIDYAAVLRTLRLDPAKPDTQALMLICERYNLDPVLRHVVLIEGRPYITRDGLLHVAHSSGDLDGIEVIDESETEAEWKAKVSVYRKSMGRPFTFSGRYSKKSSNARYGPEMALKVAEVMSLRRAFDVAVATLEERDAQPVDVPEVQIEPVDLSELDEKIMQATERGIEGNYDALRDYARQAPANLTAAIRKLDEQIATHPTEDEIPFGDEA